MSSSVGVATRLACPLCGAVEFIELKRFADEVVVGECLRCQLIYTPIPHPSPAGLFEEETLEQLKLLYAPIVDGRRRHFRERNFLDYLRLIETQAPGKRLLDVGCAHGFFAATARARGFVVTAIEPGPGMARFAETVLGLEVLKGRLEDVELGSRVFDVVSFTDSAEYLPNPRRDFAKVISHLQPGGLLFVKVPNGEYFKLRHRLEEHLGRRLGADSAFSPSRRTVHYSLRTLRRLGEQLGLEVVRMGACDPVHSPVWGRLTGIGLELEAPWFLGARERMVRRALHTLGLVEERLLRDRNDLSPSIYMLARKGG